MFFTRRLTTMARGHAHKYSPWTLPCLWISGSSMAVSCYSGRQSTWPLAAKPKIFALQPFTGKIWPTLCDITHTPCTRNTYTCTYLHVLIFLFPTLFQITSLLIYWVRDGGQKRVPLPCIGRKYTILKLSAPYTFYLLLESRGILKPASPHPS